jgi:hypothetical protein
MDSPLKLFSNCLLPSLELRYIPVTVHHHDERTCAGRLLGLLPLPVGVARLPPPLLVRSLLLVGFWLVLGGCCAGGSAGWCLDSFAEATRASGGWTKTVASPSWAQAA